MSLSSFTLPIHSFVQSLVLILLPLFALCADPMIRWVVVASRPGFGEAGKSLVFELAPLPRSLPRMVPDR